MRAKTCSEVGTKGIARGYPPPAAATRSLARAIHSLSQLMQRYSSTATAVFSLRRRAPFLESVSIALHAGYSASCPSAAVRTPAPIMSSLACIHGKPYLPRLSPLHASVICAKTCHERRLLTKLIYLMNSVPSQLRIRCQKAPVPLLFGYRVIAFSNTDALAEVRRTSSVMGAPVAI